MANTNRIESIPPELLTIVVGFIPRPTDLKSLCLTSKLLRDIATPKLYRNAVLGGTAQDLPELGHSFLATGNPGLAHVRELRVQGNACTDSAEKQVFLRRALQVLPRDTLTALNCQAVQLDEETMALLCTQQTKLTSIALGPITYDFSLALKSRVFGTALWPGLAKIEISSVLGTATELSAYGQLIARSAGLQQLAIRTLKPRVLDESLVMRSDKPDADGTFITELFRHVDRDHQAQKLATDLLWLQRANVKYADRNLARILDHNGLTKLCLYKCTNISSLLTALTGTVNLAWFTCVAKETLNTAVMEGFLGSFEGLRNCAIVSTIPQQVFDIKSLLGHKDTLHTLALAFGSLRTSAENSGLSQDVCDDITRSFSSLRRLAIQMPRLVLSDEEPSTWNTYSAALLALFSMPSLQVLRITNFPEPPNDFFSDEDFDASLNADERRERVNGDAYIRQLGIFMNTHVARVLHQCRPHLAGPLLCIKALSENAVIDGNGNEACVPSVCYYPTRQFNAFGQERRQFEEMDMVQACYLDPELRNIGNYF